MDELYRGSSEVMSQLLGDMDEGLEVTQLDATRALADLGASADEASQRPVVRLVDLMLSDGILSRASDIHIEPGEARRRGALPYRRCAAPGDEHSAHRRRPADLPHQDHVRAGHRRPAPARRTAAPGSR